PDDGRGHRGAGDRFVDRDAQRRRRGPQPLAAGAGGDGLHRRRADRDVDPAVDLAQRERLGRKPASTGAAPPRAVERNGGYSAGRYSSRSPGWHPSTRQIASRVPKRTPLMWPCLSSDRLVSLMPIASASSFDFIPHRASITSRLTTISIRRCPVRRPPP